MRISSKEKEECRRKDQQPTQGERPVPPRVLHCHTQATHSKRLPQQTQAQRQPRRLKKPRKRERSERSQGHRARSAGGHPCAATVAALLARTLGGQPCAQGVIARPQLSRDKRGRRRRRGEEAQPPFLCLLTTLLSPSPSLRRPFPPLPPASRRRAAHFDRQTPRSVSAPPEAPAAADRPGPLLLPQSATMSSPWLRPSVPPAYGGAASLHALPAASALPLCFQCAAAARSGLAGE